jgi:hypothetical protein
MISAKWAFKPCQPRDPQTFAISTRPHPQACTGLDDLCFTGPHPPGLPCQRYIRARSLFRWVGQSRPLQDCTSSVLLGHTPRPAMPEIHTHNLCSAGLGPPGPHKPARASFHWTSPPPRPLDACMIFALLVTPPRPATPEIHKHRISIPWAVPSWPTQACTISTRNPVPLRPAKLGTQHTQFSFC